MLEFIFRTDKGMPFQIFAVSFNDAVQEIIFLCGNPSWKNWEFEGKSLGWYDAMGHIE